MPVASASEGPSCEGYFQCLHDGERGRAFVLHVSTCRRHPRGKYAFVAGGYGAALFPSEYHTRVRDHLDDGGQVSAQSLGGLPFLVIPLLHRGRRDRSEEHTSELQSLRHLVCRLLLEKKKN